MRALGGCLFLCLVAAGLAAPRALALEIPARHSAVVDRANLLDDAQERTLEQRLLDFKRRTRHEVVVHTTPSLEGMTIEDYSLRVANAWGVGRRDEDDGVVLTVAPNERKLRIEVGRGLESLLSDARASDIIQTRILPAFKRSDFPAGIADGVSAIFAALERRGARVLPLRLRSLARPPERGFFAEHRLLHALCGIAWAIAAAFLWVLMGIRWASWGFRSLGYWGRYGPGSFGGGAFGSG